MRIKELDSLRGILAFLVLLSHYSGGYDSYYKHTHYIPNIDLANFAVCSFFVISGYVISMTLSSGKGYIHFISSRFSRLYPAFWASILITFTVIHLYPIRYRATDITETIINLTMLQNFLQVQEVDGVYWSLSIEIVFYIFCGLTYKFHNSKNVYLYITTLLSLQPVFHYFLSDKNIFFTYFTTYQPYFIIGFCLFKMKTIVDFNFLIVVILGGINCYIYNSIIDYLLTVTLFVLFKNNKLRFLSFKYSGLLGTISYPLYLCHQNIGYVIISYLKNYQINSYISILIATLTSITIALTIHLIVEKRINRLVYNFTKTILTKVLTRG